MDLYGKIGKFDNKWKGRKQMSANKNEKERQIEGLIKFINSNGDWVHLSFANL